MRTIIELYSFVGIIYVLVNGLIRKIYSNDDDWQIVPVHIFGWPICLICLVIDKFIKKQ